MGKRKKQSSLQTQQLKTVEEEKYAKLPHSFVFNRGEVGNNVRDLMGDIRRVMEPNTASHLKTRKKNQMKDFVSIAGPMNITHFLVFTKTDVGVYLKVARLPRGPTLTFKVNEYSLSRDVISSIRRHHMDQKQFQNAPLLVMNGFSGEGVHMKLMITMFQNMFPSINVSQVKLAQVKRCLLLNYDSNTKQMSFRHYNISVTPVGMSRSVKKLIKSSAPDLSKYDDISEYIMRGNVSESEGEMDLGQNEVTLPQHMPGKGNIKSSQSAIRLTEIGPRMSLELIKIEEGVCGGKVMYHSIVSKTEDEVNYMEAKREKKRKIKEERKRKQQENVERKNQMKEENKVKSLEGMKQSESDSEVEATETKKDDDADFDDDVEYFREAVGEEPDPDLFSRSMRTSGKFPLKRKRPQGKYGDRNESPFKKRKGPPGKYGDRDQGKVQRRGPPGKYGDRDQGKGQRRGPPGKYGDRDQGKGQRRGPPGKYGDRDQGKGPFNRRKDNPNSKPFNKQKGRPDTRPSGKKFSQGRGTGSRKKTRK